MKKKEKFVNIIVSQDASFPNIKCISIGNSTSSTRVTRGKGTGRWNDILSCQISVQELLDAIKENSFSLEKSKK